MKKSSYVLGIDTSNYKTSIAVVDLDGNIITDCRKLLQVKLGERGLRQSDALFQHINELPKLVNLALKNISKDDICAIAVAVKPRNVEKSYMPVFNAGISIASAIASVLKIPMYEFSHQEGHIEAVRKNSKFAEVNEFLVYHLSGGTSELLKVSCHKNRFKAEICGGSLDISYGQLIDRVGVAMGYPFPAGEYLDKIAIENKDKIIKQLKPIPLKGSYANLSGIETQASRLIALNEDSEHLVVEIFDKIIASIYKSVIQATKDTGIRKIIFAGGVSESIYIRKKLEEMLPKENIEYIFGSSSLAQDNAVGIAFLGGRSYEASEGFTIK